MTDEEAAYIRIVRNQLTAQRAELDHRGAELSRGPASLPTQIAVQHLRSARHHVDAAIGAVGQALEGAQEPEPRWIGIDMARHARAGHTLPAAARMEPGQ